MEFINLSHKPLKIGGIKEGLLKLVVLPDYCLGKGLLPVGLVAVYDRKNHVISSDYLGPDVGCGMMLARFKGEPKEDLNYITYSVASELALEDSEKGTLGGGNHFITFYEIEDTKKPNEFKKGDKMVLIHSGSRLKGEEFYYKGLLGEKYLLGYEEIINYAKENRELLLKRIERGNKEELELILDKTHNAIEILPDKIIYRKGAIKLCPRELVIIPSSMGGEAILVTGKDKISFLENSMCHGTGRKFSRSEAKKMHYNFDKLRREIYIPNLIDDNDIKTEGPDCYQTIEDIFPIIKDYIEIIAKLKPKAVITQ